MCLFWGFSVAIWMPFRHLFKTFLTWQLTHEVRKFLTENKDISKVSEYSIILAVNEIILMGSS